MQQQAYQYKLAKAKAESRDRCFNNEYRTRAEKVYGGIDAYHAQAANWLAPEQLAAYQRAQIVLQPKQLEFAHHAYAANDINRPRKIGFGGSRGPGKSFAALAEAVVECQLFDGLSVLYLRKTGKAAQEQLTRLYGQLLQYVDCRATAFNIQFPNGSLITIGGYKDDNEALKYQGQEYDLIIFEEATQLSEHTMKTLMLSLRTSKAYRPRAFLPTNPLGIGHGWYKRLYVDPHKKKQATDTVFIPATIDDNHFVDPEYVKELDDLVGAEKRAYRYGDFDVAAGAYFETWDYEAHTYDASALTVYPDWEFAAGMDAGFHHWNMTYLVAQAPDAQIYVIDEIAHRKQHPAAIAADIKATLATWGLSVDRLSYFKIGTDAFRQTLGQENTVADQYRAHGITMTAADMSPGSRVAGWQQIARLLGDPRNDKLPRLRISRKCTRLIDLLPYLLRNPNNAEDVLKVNADDEGRGGDDAADALRYALDGVETMGSAFLGAVNYATYPSF